MDASVTTQGPDPEAIARHVWHCRYRWVDEGSTGEHAIGETWLRVARALALPEGENKEYWEQQFLAVLRSLRFLPGGRILKGAGTAQKVTLMNCFVMGRVDDSMGGIFEALREGAITMQRGGGVGIDFSTLRPCGMVARTTGTIASGPVSFMHIWDAMCATVLSTGARRGAMMATLRCDHPDIEEFVTAKREARTLRHFNLSVLVTDAFLNAVDQGLAWPPTCPSIDCAM